MTAVLGLVVGEMSEWVKVTQLYPTVCNPVDCSLPGCSVRGILQARILEWGAISFSRGFSWSRDGTQVPCIASRFFAVWATRESPVGLRYMITNWKGDELAWLGFLLQWSAFWVQADETWEWNILRDSVCKEVFRVGDTRNLNCVKRKVKTWDHEKMLELMNLMELIKMVDWGSEGRVLEGGEESTSLCRIWTPFFVICFACWRWILVSLRTLVQSTPLLSPQFYSLHVLLVNKWTRGPIRVAHSHYCRSKSDSMPYLPHVVMS